jgi:hypothetical protein
MLAEAGKKDSGIAREAPMKTIKVLLIGRGLERSKNLPSLLEKWACQPHCVSSFPDAIHLLGKEPFDLVVSSVCLERNEAHALHEALKGMPTTLLHPYEVEDGCLWLLSLDRGKPCLGDAPSIRRNEAMYVLDAILRELACGRRALPRVLRQIASVVPLRPAATRDKGGQT